MDPRFNLLPQAAGNADEVPHCTDPRHNTDAHYNAVIRYGTEIHYALEARYAADEACYFAAGVTTNAYFKRQDAIRAAIDAENAANIAVEAGNAIAEAEIADYAAAIANNAANEATEANKAAIAADDVAFAASNAADEAAATATHTTIIEGLKNCDLVKTHLDSRQFDWNVPNYVKLTPSGKPFLLYDSHCDTDDGRILIFSNDNHLELLRKVGVWSIFNMIVFNSKFRRSHMFTITGMALDYAVLLLHAFLPDRTERTYHRLFSKINSLQPTTTNVNVIVTVFDQNIIGVLKECYPGVQIIGSATFMERNFWKKVEDFKIYDLIPKDRVTVYVQLYRMLRLVYTAKNEVMEDYKALLNDEFYRIHRTQLANIVDYFEDLYIGKIDESGGPRNAPQFPLEIWNYNNIQHNMEKFRYYNYKLFKSNESFNMMLRNIRPVSPVVLYNILRNNIIRNEPLVNEILYKINTVYANFNINTLMPGTFYNYD